MAIGTTLDYRQRNRSLDQQTITDVSKPEDKGTLGKLTRGQGRFKQSKFTIPTANHKLLEPRFQPIKNAKD